MVVKKKSLPASAGDPRDAGWIPGLGKSRGRGNGNPLQYSYLGNPMEGGAGRLQSMGSQSQTWLSIHAYTPNSLNWFRILDLWVLAENQKMSGSGSDMRPVSLLLCTCERAGLHQCFPGCRMRQVNEMFLDGLASSWKNMDSQSRHAPRLGFQNIGCFIFVVIIYVSDIC